MTAGSPPWAERDRVGAGLEVLGAGLDAYLTHSYGPDWPNLLAAHDATRDIGGKSYVRRNPQCGLRMLTERVAGVAALLEEQRRMASRVREIRDAWAHFAPFSTKRATDALRLMAHLLDELGEGGHRDDLWQLGGGGPPSPQEIRRQQYDQLRQAYMRRLPDHVVTGGMMGIRLREWWETRFAPQMQQRSAAKNAAETRNRAMGFETKRRFAEAEALYRGAAVAGDAAAGAHAARMMEQRGSEGEAEDWYGSAARAGHLPAADAGYVGAMVELAGMLRRRGDVEAVESWLRKAADMGSPDAMETLADMLKGRGDGQEAQSWRARAEEARIVSVTFETSNPPMPNSDG